MNAPSTPGRQAAWMGLWHAWVGFSLDGASVPHVLIKGCTWAPELRVETVPVDVDVLVAPHDLARAVAAMLAAGCSPAHGRTSPHEVALHSTTLRAPGGPEVDVHSRFPGLDRPAELTWRAVYEQRSRLDLGHRPQSTPCLEHQVLIAAASVARDGADGTSARRLRQAVATVRWEIVAGSATALHVDGALRGGLETIGETALADRLGLGPVPHHLAAFRSRGERRLEEVLSHPWRRRALVALRELWPSPAFLALSQPGRPVGWARLRHLAHVGRTLGPAALHAAVRRLRR